MAYAGSTTFENYQPADETHAAARVRLDAIARFFDSAFTLPGTNIRFGADALLNLFPGAGTLLSSGVSAYLVWEARRLGAPKILIGRMLANVGVDTVISAVPLVGWVGDVFFRANLRNMKLLRDHLDKVARNRVEEESITTTWRVVR
ncbi:DUF4112 domain-containing protein [Iodidimonas sp. SYSU 1G8]|uniref:DUF4112 domain-containing protein n=1 Tax=Iodidimonas sp. SYSU 1G8 TaxID=3133967 RepID=UPI0031FE7475